MDTRWANVHSPYESKVQIKKEFRRIVGKTPWEGNKEKVEKSLWHEEIR